MKPDAFTELCRNAAFYLWPTAIGTPIARGGVTPAGVHWIVTVEQDGFHVLPTANLTETISSGAVVWRDSAGRPAFGVSDLSLCEELNPADARAAIEAARADYFTADGAAWLKMQIEGAERAPANALQYHPPTNPAESNAGDPPVEK